MDSSSSSRSRSVILPESSAGLPAAHSRLSTSTRLSSSRFSGGMGLNDSGVGSTGTTITKEVVFPENERNLGRSLRFPSSSGGCKLITGGVEDCSKFAQKQFPSSLISQQPHSRNYYDNRYGKLKLFFMQEMTMINIL